MAGTVLILLGLGVVAWVLWGPMQMTDSVSPKALERHIIEVGLWGPVLIIGFLVLAIVLTPIPSAPVAMAAGAVYGDVWGTLYVVIGAELGAVLAFGLARMLGHPVMLRWFGERVEMGLLGSQNFLMFTVLASRAMPFVSFDIVSYAAGLSALRFWRFALATLLGIVPVSFLLVHFGASVGDSDPAQMTLASLGMALLLAVPLIIGAVRSHWRGSD
jgi:uncharacterized membrane protein YdjX (TVP38/TMEM64 family)